MLRSTLIFILSCLPTLAMAHNIQMGKSLPTIAIQDGGDIVIEQDDFKTQAWDSASLQGKVRLIQHIAGRSAAKELNAPMIDAIKAAKLPEETYQTTTIINKDDAIWGTGSFVTSSAQDSKKEFPWSSIVLDEDGVVAKTWQLEPKSSAIVLLDSKGQVLFVKDGQLNDEEIKQVMALIKQQLAS